MKDAFADFQRSREGAHPDSKRTDTCGSDGRSKHCAAQNRFIICSASGGNMDVREKVEKLCHMSPASRWYSRRRTSVLGKTLMDLSRPSTLANLVLDLSIRATWIRKH